MNQFLLWHWDGRVRIWHGSILSCISGSGCWWCNGVGDISSPQFGLFSTNWASFKCHRLPPFTNSIPLWPQRTILKWLFKQVNTPFHKSQIISNCFWNMTMTSLYSNGLHYTQMAFTILKWPPQSEDVMKWEICILDVQWSCVMLSCQYRPKSLRMSPAPCWINAIKN